MTRFVQVFTIENQQGDNAATDGGVRKIENRAEKDEMLSSHKRHPCRPIGFNNRKIEHIYHFPVKPTGISPVVGHERGYLRMGTFIENDTIENTVDDISQSARQNQGNTNDISGFRSSFDNFVKIPADKSDGK